MISLVDLILLKDRSLKRDDVQKILSITTETIKENLAEGKDVLWVDLCTFTYKAPVKTKKAAAFLAENPDKAIKGNLRIEADESIKGLSGTGGIMKRTRKKKDEE